MMNKSYLGLLALQAICAFVAPAMGAADMGQPTGDGKPAIYLDVDIDGRILEVNQLTKSAEIVGSIASVQTDTIVYMGGKATPDRQYALLFFHDIHGPRYPIETPYLFSRKDGTLAKSPLSYLPAGDGAIVVVDSTSIFITEAIQDSRHFKGTIYSAVKNETRGSFDFRISPYTLNPDLVDDTYAYFSESTGSSVIRVNAVTGAVANEFDMREIVGTDEPRKGVWVQALLEDFALVARRFTEDQHLKLFLVNLNSQALVAESDLVPYFFGKFLLYYDANQDLIVSCIEEKVVKSKRIAAGVLRTFRVEGDSIAIGREATFDPKTQIVVTDESGTPIIIPRYRFDYLSMREVQREIFRKLPTAALGSVEARQRVRDEVIQEFNNPDQVGFVSRNRTHLEIR